LAIEFNAVPVATSQVNADQVGAALAAIVATSNNSDQPPAKRKKMDL
jgi:hypothetical protein